MNGEEKVFQWHRSMENLTQSSPEFAKIVEDFFDNLKANFPPGNLTFPTNSLHKEQSFVIIWENQQYYLDFEIYQNGELGYIYRDRLTTDFEMGKCKLDDKKVEKWVANFVE